MVRARWVPETARLFEGSSDAPPSPSGTSRCSGDMASPVRRALPLLVALAALGAATPAGAAGPGDALPAGSAVPGDAVPQPPDCPLLSPGTAVEHPLGSTGLVARDPYGGRLSRNRLFFDFSVKGPATALDRVARAEWYLDGVLKRSDPTRGFSWAAQSGSSKRMP